MGAFKDLFKKNSTDQSPSSSPTSPARPHSTLDLDLPRPPQPLWALATEPDLSRHTYSAGRRSFGPREPWEKRHEYGRNRTTEPNREERATEDRRVLQRPDGRDGVNSMQELGTGVGDLRLNISTQSRSNPSQPPPFSNPSTPSRPSLTSPSRSTQHGHSSLSAPSASPRQPLQSYPPHPPSRNPVLPPNPYSPTHSNVYPSSSTTPFASYPPYPSPPAHLPSATQQLHKPLPSPSHSPDRPRPLPRPIPSSSSSRSISLSSRSPSPLKPASRSPSPPKTSTKPTTPRKKLPPVCIELSSSTESSAEYSDSDDQDSDSSIEFVNTSSSSRTSPSSFKTNSSSPTRAKVTTKGGRTPSPFEKGKTSIISQKTSSNPISSATASVKKRTPTSKIPSHTPPSTNSTPRRRRAGSSSPASPIKKQQCHGLTSSGKRCTRLTTPSTNLIDRDSNEEEGGEVGEMGEEPIYCHQHTKLSLIETGCYVLSKAPSLGEKMRVGEGMEEKGKRKREIWVNYSDWILPDLPLATQSLLRYYMAEPVSEKDRPGYIYIHELVDKNSPPSSTSPSSRTYLKLGRTIHPILRLSQWRSSCPSLDPIVRDILPRSLPSTSPNRKRFADTGTENCHRWERLCLVEIAGRLELEQGAEKESREKCRDCGKRHLECFWVGRDAFGEMGARDAGGGWVVEVVERWERWCRDVLG